MRRLRFAVQPGWLALHAVTVALVVTMIFLGRWQLTVSEDKGFSLQNFGYALQWWAFSAFVLGMWARAMRDAARKQAAGANSADEPDNGALPRLVAEAEPEPVVVRTQGPSYRHYVMPTTSAPRSDDDPVHAAYNNYLAQLAAEDVTADDTIR